MKTRIAVFASGFGSNLQALIDFSKKNELGGEIVLVFSNNRNAFALKRARENKIKAIFEDPEKYSHREAYDDRIFEILKEEKIGLIVLAGYMYLLGPQLVKNFTAKIINIHPALLPSFKGVHGISDAFNYGVKVTGVTVHFVDEGLDSGPIIAQEALEIKQEETIDELEERIHAIEHRIYPEAVKLYCEGRLVIEGRKVKVLK